MALEPFFSLRTVPGNVWPALPAAELSLVWAAYQTLERTQWLDGAAIEGQQLVQVRLLLAHCVQHVPYYRDLLRTAGVAPNDVTTRDALRRIPLLTRRVYQERSADIQARSLPAGTVPVGKLNTAGTTGIVLDALTTNVSQLWWLAFYLRDLEWSGLDPRRSLAGIRLLSGRDQTEKLQLLEGVSLPFWNRQLTGLIESGPSHGMDIHQDPRRQLAWLRRIRPDYLLSYPSNLDYLASLVRAEGQAVPGLQAIQTFAETLTEEAQTRIESAFGVPVKNLYSCSEAGYIASPCPEGHGLHVHAENVLVEVIDEEGRPCCPAARGRVVLTTLHNFLTPFIRYDIGDEAVLGPERCPCGRGLPLLERAWGKRRPLLRLPDGRRKSPVALVEGFRYLGGIRQHQIVQRVDRVIVRLVPGPDWTSEHPDRAQRIVHEFFEAPVRTEVEVYERLPLPPGGKLVDVVCEVPEG